MIDDFLDKIICGDALEVSKQIPDNSIDVIITSPPYWKLRDYGEETCKIWDGDPNCEHEWGDEISKKIRGSFENANVGSNKKGCQPKELKQGQFCKKCGCYDEETETLTNNGWKLFKNITKNDLVATLENGYLVFRKPTRYFIYDYDGEMIRFEGQNIDLLVTPNHNMWIKRRNKNNFDFIEAEKVKFGYKVKRYLYWKGKEIKYFELPIVKDNRNRKKFDKPIRILMKDWLKFLGLYLAEGGIHYREHNKHSEYLVYISQKNKVNEVKEIFNKLPFKWSYRKNKFLIYNKSLYFYLKQFGNTYNKHIPREFCELSSSLLIELLIGYLIGDGHIRKDGRIEAYTVSENLADDLQEIGLKLGYATTISKHKDNRGNRKILYRIAFLKNQKETGIWHIKRIKYKGKVYCVEVPNHILLVRRNKKVCWCGNSWYGQLGLEPHPQMYINHLIQIFRELKRVLKTTGSFWLNIGDTYCGSGMGTWKNMPKDYKSKQVYYLPFESGVISRVQYDGKWLQPKQLMLIPSRVAIALQEDGWILRNDVIWRKPNAMPSSVEDRLNTTYEHLFHFVKNDKTILWRHRKTKEWTHKRPIDKSIVVCPLCKGKKKVIDNGYFGDIEIECPECNGKGKVWIWKGFDYYYDLDLIREAHKELSIKRAKYKSGNWSSNQYAVEGLRNNMDKCIHPLGKNPGDVFDIPTEPFSEAHFAIFPMALIDKPLRATLPKDGIVLDPFGGRGTVGRWCRKNWGHYIIIDINPKYCEMANLFIKGQKKSGYKKCRKLEAYYD